MWADQRGNFASPPAAMSGNVAMLTSVGTIATPALGEAAGWCPRSGRWRARCSRCPPRPGRAGESSAKQCAVTRAPSRCASAMAASTSSRGQQAVRSPASRSIQSPTSLTQPSPRRASARHVRDEVVGLDLVGVVADVAAGAGDVPAGPDDLRQVLAVVDPAGVGRATRRRGSAGCRRRGRSSACFSAVAASTGAVGVQPDVAVRVDQPGQRPAGHGGHVAAARPGARR